ncbi:AAA domain-containing protein [Metabacillus litoralis]|uniref:AAA domain-containing protein n=1 Tax=Metabacillus litoralis TaxID=152268 RepID=UPI001CFE7788|nr:AAA domain-containing protein [Metabacillus litoralis]
MHSSKYYIQVWQKALRAEIMHLKKYGSSKYALKNGQLVSKNEFYTYYFETSQPIRIPIGTTIKVEVIQQRVNARILSSEGNSVIISVEQSLGDLESGLFLSHDPWELLDQLHERLEEIKESKRKRSRIKRLMNPSHETRHPTAKIKSNIHELVLRSKYNPVTFVWGPPGTGKTYTLGRVAANKYFKNQAVLILSQSNQAVDVLMNEVSHFVDKKERLREGDLLRYGSQSSLISHTPLTTIDLLEKRYPDLAQQKQQLQEERNFLKKDLGKSYNKRDTEKVLFIEGKLASVLEKIRQKEIDFVNDAMVIGTTLSKAANDPTIYEKNYDVVIVDEASMAYIPQIAFAASLGQRIIICGDFKQLPPIATAKHSLVDDWLREDIFHKTGVVNWLNSDEQLHPNLFLLREQRRMHPDISSFTNKHIYHSLVGDHQSVKTARNEIVERTPFPNRASILLDSSYTGNHCLRDKDTHSRYNLWQLLLSFQLIHEAYLSGATSIGYITPYRTQALLMESLLQEIYSTEIVEADIIAATVHRFQGSERDVMIFDTVDSFPQERPGMLLVGKESDRLLNVAITRTRGKFIHLCDQHFIKSKVYKSKTIRQLVEHQLIHHQEVLPKDIGSWIKNQHSNVKWIHAKKLDEIQMDVEKAKRTIIIGLPSNRKLPDQWVNILLNKNKHVQLLIISNLIDSRLKESKFEKKIIHFPFVMIDEECLWLGMPFEATKDPVKPPFVGIRLISKAICEYFLTQIN